MHTPGPWREGKTGGTVVCDTPIGGDMGHDVIEYYGGHLVAESIGRKADVALIAAAPDLLAALEITRGQWIHSVNAEQCLSAIAKAKGETE